MTQLEETCPKCGHHLHKYEFTYDIYPPHEVEIIGCYKCGIIEEKDKSTDDRR